MNYFVLKMKKFFFINITSLKAHNNGNNNSLHIKNNMQFIIIVKIYFLISISKLFLKLVLIPQ